MQDPGLSEEDLTSLVKAFPSISFDFQAKSMCFQGFLHDFVSENSYSLELRALESSSTPTFLPYLCMPRL